MADRRSILPLSLDGVGYAAKGEVLLAGLSLALEAGSRTVVLGPNGAGKSLLLRLCHGLLAPTAGRVEWQGPAGERSQGAHALVFQRPVLLRRSALANVTYALSLARVPRRQRRARATAALARVGLEELARRPARVLSGGEQQRLALARVWATRPQVLFLDEPTANLDPAATRAIEGIIQAFHDEGTKIAMTTHDLGQARRLADEVVFLHRGRLLEITPAASFFERPSTGEARAFMQGDLLW